MSKKLIAFILAGGSGGKLLVLTRKRAKAALPYGGRYRVIDFALSNCVNSGIFDIGLLTQFRPQSLNQHIGVGKPWDLDRLRGGIRILQPYLREEASNWYRGTADAIYQNMDYINDTDPDDVLVVSGDQVYKMDYRELLKFHRSHNANVTIAVTEVPREKANKFGIVELKGNEVISFEEKPKDPKTNIAFMGIYLFKKDFLVERLKQIISEDKFDLVFNIIIESLKNREKIYAYRFFGFWEDIGTIEAYYSANMELIKPLPKFNLYDRRWVIKTKSEEKPPVKVGKNAKIYHSIIANGCIINGEVENSLLFPGVYISEKAKIVNSIIMNDTYISKYALIKNAILDKDIRIGEYVIIGEEDDHVLGETSFEHTYGITSIGKGTHIPAGTKIGRDCMIDAFIGEHEFTSKYIESGKSLLKKEGF